MAANGFEATVTVTERQRTHYEDRPGYRELVGYRMIGTIEADDPRLSGRWERVQNSLAFDQEVPNDQQGPWVGSNTVRIDGQHGGWIGTETSFFGPEGSGTSLGVLNGQGAYEGLGVLYAYDDEERPFLMMGIDGIVVPRLPASLPSLQPPAE
jgi:hypothetical protein